jgi:ABC-type histidine transport system ATPase subunit
MTESATALIAEDIHKSFGSLEVLKGISMTAHDGDVISIIGSSGSGKSTFLRCINFLETPDRGRIVVGGEEVRIKADRQGRSIGADHAQIDRLRTRLGHT